jgi:hypothetical protein
MSPDNLISKHWGDGANKHREAHVYMDDDGIYSVQFWSKSQLMEDVKMNPDGIPRSLRYAEDAAENWCLGYMP